MDRRGASFGSRKDGVSYVVRPSAYAVICNGASVLLVRSVTGEWYLPGGGLEVDEASERGLIREIQEELGCLATVEEPFAEACQLLHSPAEQMNFELQATYHSASLQDFTASSGEHSSEWVPIEKARDVLKREADRWALDLLGGD